MINMMMQESKVISIRVFLKSNMFYDQIRCSDQIYAVFVVGNMYRHEEVIYDKNN